MKFNLTQFVKDINSITPAFDTNPESGLRGFCVVTKINAEDHEKVELCLTSNGLRVIPAVLDVIEKHSLTPISAERVEDGFYCFKALKQ